MGCNCKKKVGYPQPPKPQDHSKDSAKPQPNQKDKEEKKDETK